MQNLRKREIGEEKPKLIEHNVCFGVNDEGINAEKEGNSEKWKRTNDELLIVPMELEGRHGGRTSDDLRREALILEVDSGVA